MGQCSSMASGDKLPQNDVSRQFSNEFLEAHQSMVEGIATRISATVKLPPGLGRDDLIHFGYEGLLKAKLRFKDGLGAEFKTFAYYRVRGEILDHIRKEWVSRRLSDSLTHRKKIEDRIVEVTQTLMAPQAGGSTQQSASLGDLVSSASMVYMMSVDDYESVAIKDMGSDMADDILNQVEQRASQVHLFSAMDTLDKLEKEFVRLFYYEDKKQNEIATILKLSKSKVCRLHVKLLSKLKAHLESK